MSRIFQSVKREAVSGRHENMDILEACKGCKTLCQSEGEGQGRGWERQPPAVFKDGEPGCLILG